MGLEKMLEEAMNEQDHDTSEGRTQSVKNTFVGEKMAELFLETIRAWGPTSALRRRIQLHRYCAQNHQWGLRSTQSSGRSVVATTIQQAEKDLQRRISQTAFGVLADALRSTTSAQNNSIRQYIDSSKDSLFDIDHLIARLAARLQLSDRDDGGSVIDHHRSSDVLLGNMKSESAILVESMAELELMRECYGRALGYYLAIGSHFMMYSLSSLEESAVQSVNFFYENRDSPQTYGEQDTMENDNYIHVLSLIELHQLYPILLKRNFFFTNEKDDMAAESPIISLIMLVGLSRAGRFLMDNCAPPEGTQKIDLDESSYGEHYASFSGSNLPIDLVAKQMKSRPKLLYWFLFQVFILKPDMYVKFPTTAVPPVAITDLHRLQFSLFVDYGNKDGSKTTGISPSALIANKDTSFMSFLRVSVVGFTQRNYLSCCSKSNMLCYTPIF